MSDYQFELFSLGAVVARQFETSSDFLEGKINFRSVIAWITLQELVDKDRTEGMKKECYPFNYLHAENRGSNTTLADSLSEAME